MLLLRSTVVRTVAGQFGDDSMRSDVSTFWSVRKQRETIRSWRFGSKVEHRLKVRASIIWGLFHHHCSVDEVASRVGVTSRTVRKWQRRFCMEGIDGLHDRPRSGAPCRYSVEQRCEVVALACDDPSRFGFDWQSSWTYDTLVDAVHRTVKGCPMSRTSVWRTLNRITLKPHRLRLWMHSRDPHFREKVNAVVSWYLDPPDDAVVLCIDEKTGMQARERKYETRRPIPGRPGRYECEYTRHGTQSLLAAFNVRTGEVTAACGDTRTAEDLVQFMDHVAQTYSQAKRIVVIWDNLNIHHDGPSQRWTHFNERHDHRFEFVYTPLHASWVNQVELFFSILHRRCLKHGSFTSQDDLRAKVMAFIAQWNVHDGHPFRWSFRGYPMQDKAVA